MHNHRFKVTPISTELSIEKALEFVGDNSTYQKKRLLLVCIIVFALGVLTTRTGIESSSYSIFFLIASGIGQVVCPIKMSLRTITIGIGASNLAAIGLYPIGGFIRAVGLMGVGFFTRGFFVSSLIYLNEIGGDRFRAWSMLVIFGLWPLSSFFNSIDSMLGLAKWQVYYLLIFLPCLIGSYFILENWHESPHHLYFKKQYAQTKEVLNRMAYENQRPYLPYDLQGENEEEELGYRRPGYFDLIQRDILRKITIPLFLVWIYREYMYYASNMMIPEFGDEHSRIYAFLSISQAAAVLISYPIRMNVKRVNSMAGTIIVVLVMSLISSFSTVSEECRESTKFCVSKILYFLTLMVIRFGMSLLGLILLNYTLEVYPSNVRRLGFSMCLAVSSIGSICMPSFNQLFVSLGLSGFITFTLSSIFVLFFVPRLEQTMGRMKIQTLQEMQNDSAVALRNWALLDF